MANSLNRTTIESLEAGRKSAAEQQSGAQDPGKADLAESEINERLDQAKNDSENFNLQKGLGLALYQFAALKQDEERLDDVEVLLQRAYTLNADDYEVLVAFGNINFDLAMLKKDAARVNKARGLFREALEKNPKDVRVLNSLASTYLQTENADPDKAITYLRSALEIDGRSEPVVLNLARANLAKGNIAQARVFVSKLKEINKANPEINRLEGRIRMEESR